MNWKYKTRKTGIEPHPSIELFIHDIKNRKLIGPKSALLDTGADMTFVSKSFLKEYSTELPIIDSVNHNGRKSLVYGLNYLLVFDHFNISDYEYIVDNLFGGDEKLIKCLYRKKDGSNLYVLKQKHTNSELELIISCMEFFKPVSYFIDSPTIVKRDSDKAIIGRTILNRFSIAINGPSSFSTYIPE